MLYLAAGLIAAAAIALALRNYFAVPDSLAAMARRYPETRKLVIVNDPNSRRNSEKHWDAAVLAAQMKAIWLYSL